MMEYATKSQRYTPAFQLVMRTGTVVKATVL